MRDLTPLMEPRSVAVIGASASPTKPGYLLLKNIVDCGYPGAIYPINPRGGAILGQQAYPTIGDVPGAVDLAFVVLGRETIPDVLRACINKGVRAALVITAGFREVGGAGDALQEQLEAIARDSDLLVVGPNTIGMISMPGKLVASFVPFPTWTDGPVALFSQTGLFGGALMAELMSQEVQRLGIACSLPVGNKIGVDEIDYLDYARQKPGIRAVGLYLEALRDPRGFAQAAGALNRAKPVVVLKPGRQPSGARASRAHTGSAPLDNALVDAALGEAGVYRAEDLEELFACLKMMTWQPLPRGRRIAIATWTGAQGVIAMDQVDDCGLVPAEISAATRERLAPHLPDWLPVLNPVDVWPALDRGPRLVTEETLGALLADPANDMVLGMVLAVEGADFPEVREVFADLRARYPDKPLALVIFGPAEKTYWLRQLEGLQVPVFASTRLAIRALAAAARQGEAARRA
jgi:acetate---CoA ligase (ADP-forming)